MKFLVAEKDLSEMVRVNGYVWCDSHGQVHQDETDPFDEGTNCRRIGWRHLWMEAP